MREARPKDPLQKALAVNLDPRRYGTFAEIGAGQEVVRWFFRAGGAAGTIAKSISAYDMTVSDAIYGRCDRYVCRQRLERMLEYEHVLNLERLRERRGNTTAFFAFADTVKAASYAGSSQCHGWLGVRFQSHPRDADSQIILHVNMLDREKEAQQEALGVVGVNLVYGACFLFHEPELIVESLLDDLSIERVEIDMIEFSGIEFRHVDNRLMSLKLVQLGLTGAAMFAADGSVLQPSEVLHKKPVLVQRGSFRPVTHVNVDMLECALARFEQEPEVRAGEIVPLMEITMRNLMAAGSAGTVDVRDFLARADVLAACGTTVLISDYFEYYRLAAYLSRYTDQPIARRKKRYIVVEGLARHRLVAAGEAAGVGGQQDAEDLVERDGEQDDVDALHVLQSDSPVGALLVHDHLEVRECVIDAIVPWERFSHERLLEDGRHSHLVEA